MQPTVRNIAVAASLAVPAAMLATVLGVAAVFVIEVPASGLVWHSWRALVDVRSDAWLTVFIVAVPLTAAFRPVTPPALDVWLQRRNLPVEVAGHAAAELRRTRLLRTTPAVLGASVGLGTHSAYNLAIARGFGAATSEPLHTAAAAGGVASSPFTLAVAGYLLGTIAAEWTRRRPDGDAGRSSARLEARRPASYLTRPARILPAAVGGILIVLAGAGFLAFGETSGEPWPRTPSLITTGVVGVLLLAGVPAVRWWVIQRPQRHDDPAKLALDDTFRSSAAHGVVGASAAAGLAVISTWLTPLWNSMVGGSTIVMWLLVVAGLAVTAGTAVVWLRFGTAHAGRRPATGRARA